MKNPEGARVHRAPFVLSEWRAFTALFRRPLRGHRGLKIAACPSTRNRSLNIDIQAQPESAGETVAVLADEDVNLQAVLAR